MPAGIIHWGFADTLTEPLAPADRRATIAAAVLHGTGTTNSTAGGGENDESLMRQYQRGDEAAFRILYERHRSALLRFVMRMAPQGGEHEEIAQETWMAVIKGRERFLPKARFATYLFSIARRRTMDRWRRRGKLPAYDSEALDSVTGPIEQEPDAHASNAELGVDLLAAIESLPLPQREAFLLRAEGGLSIDEIAAVTGANRETAKSRLRFALSRLRAAMESWHGG